jgi:hypothetical protein
LFHSTGHKAAGKVSTTPYNPDLTLNLSNIPLAEDNPSSVAAQELPQVTPKTEDYLYFAYGTDMSSEMINRLSGAEFVSLAKLDGYKFFVNQHGKPTCMDIILGQEMRLENEVLEKQELEKERHFQLKIWSRCRLTDSLQPQCLYGTEKQLQCTGLIWPLLKSRRISDGEIQTLLYGDVCTKLLGTISNG